MEVSRFCIEKNCRYCREWDFVEGSCISCELIGQSYSITEYPNNCIHLEEIKEYEKELTKPKNTN